MKGKNGDRPLFSQGADFIINNDIACRRGAELDAGEQ